MLLYALLLILLTRLLPNGVFAMHELPTWLRQRPQAGHRRKAKAPKGRKP
jgi:hypothetical protein